MQRKKKTSSESYCPSMSMRLNLKKRTPNYATSNLTSQRKRLNTLKKVPTSQSKKQKLFGSSRNLLGKFSSGKGNAIRMRLGLLDRTKDKGMSFRGPSKHKPLTFSQINSNRKIGVSTK
jgi:hypothetical protein